MIKNLMPEMQDIKHLLNSVQITNLYNNEYSKIKQRRKEEDQVQSEIQKLEQKINSINNYKSNLEYVKKYYEQIKIQLNNSFMIFNTKTDKIDSEIQKLEIEKKEHLFKLDSYKSILTNIKNKKIMINEYIRKFPKNKAFFSRDIENIDMQIKFMNSQIQTLNKIIADLKKQIDLLINQNKVRIQEKERIQSYLNNMIEHPEKSYLSVNVNALNSDKSRVEQLTNQLNILNRYKLSIDFDAQQEFNKLYQYYVSGSLTQEAFKEKLEKYKENLNRDNLISNEEPRIFDELNQKIDSLLAKVKQPVVVDEDNMVLDDSVEIIDIRPAQKTTIDKLKGKITKIAAFCLSAVFTLNIGVSSNFLNSKNKYSNNLNQSLATSAQTIVDNLYVPNIDIDNADIQQRYFIPDTIKIQDGASIYDNSYDAIKDNNAMHPYFDYDQNKNVCGVTIEMPDGSIKTLYKDSKDFINNYYNLIDSGGTVKLYLTEHNNEYEGFYRADDGISTGMRR